MRMDSRPLRSLMGRSRFRRILIIGGLVLLGLFGATRHPHAVLAWAYAVKGSFPAALLLHALAGQIVFTSGLGVLFYHGAVN